MQDILYKDYIFHTDVTANRRSYAHRPAAPVSLSDYLPELTSFLDALGIDVNKPRPPFDGFSDLCYDIQGTFSTSTGFELDFSAPDKYVSCVLYEEHGRITVEVFGIHLCAFTAKEALMEHWEALKPGGYRFVYDDGLFRPGTDTFLLSSLPRLKPGLRVCDLGCGTGLLGLLLLQREPALSVAGVEIQEAAVRLAERAAVENGLADRLTFRHGDLRDIKAMFPTGSFDLVVCNPPYYPADSGRLAADEAVRTARSEVSCTLEDVCRAASYLLRWGGSFCLVHKPERLTDLLCALRQAAIEPKRLRFVCSTAGAAPSLLLVEGRRGGKPELTVEAPLILQNSDGTPTPEVNAIYFRQQEETP